MHVIWLSLLITGIHIETWKYVAGLSESDSSAFYDLRFPSTALSKENMIYFTYTGKFLITQSSIRI